MKTKNIWYLIIVICYGILFYDQQAGINYPIFASIIICASYCMFPQSNKSKTWILLASGLLLSSIFTCYYTNALTISMSIISFIIFMIIQKTPNLSLSTSLIYGVFSIMGSFVFMILGNIYAQRVKKIQSSKQSMLGKKFISIFIVFLISFLFLSLYRSINPVFNTYFSHIFDNISIGFVFFTLFGSVLLYTFFYPTRTLRKLYKREQNIGNTIIPVQFENIENNKKEQAKIEQERFTGTLLFVILNILLLFLNSTDVYYLLFKAALPDEMTYATYVHKGVGAVIVAIILAIGLISFFFRGILNFDSKSKYVRILSYVWLLQNLVLVVMAAWKNNIYIDTYSLTFKRIGVYFYIAFATIALASTLYKLYFKKNTWFLFRFNSISIYSILIVACVFNWNMIVTKHNISHTRTADNNYLAYMGFANYPSLFENDMFNTMYSRYCQLELTNSREEYYLPYEIADFLEKYEKSGKFSYSYTKHNTYMYFQNKAKQNLLPRQQPDNEIIESKETPKPIEF